MRAFTTILLTLAAVATAAPSAGSEGVNVLEVRQADCVYRCGCQTVNGVPGNTQGCCTIAGGNYDGNLCDDLTIPTHNTFKTCCGSLSNSVCFRSSRDCPE